MNLSGGASAAPQRVTNTPTLVSEEALIEGKISSKGSLRVEGRVVGEIYAEDTITLGASGQVEGNLEARTVLIGGSVKGNVRASDKLEIQPQGTVTGDIFTPYGRLIVQEGGRLEGKCSMSKDVQMKGQAPAPRVVEAIPPSVEKRKNSETV